MIDTVFIHAFPYDQRMWAPQQGALSPTAELHTLDLPGFGNSSETLPSSMDDMADAVHDFVNELDLESFVLGGLSMGGYVTFAYWRKYADEGRIRGLVLADTKSGADDEVGRQRRHVQAEQVRGGDVGGFVDQVAPLMFGSEPHADVVQRARSIMETQAPEGIAAALEAMAARPDSTDLLPEIDVPVALLCGTEDRITPPDGMKAMTVEIPDATWFPIRAAGHLANMENAEQFNAALVAFLMGLE